MTENKKCPRCGAELPPNAPAGICPKCLLGAGLGTEDAGHERADDRADGASPRFGFVPPPAETLAPFFPQLEILELLGHGGMGAVYRARQIKLDRSVALKIIRPESAEDRTFAERFHREARTLARLNHPNIVAVHDFGEVEFADPRAGESQPGTLYYFLMEFVDGVNLRQVIQSGDLPPQQALAVVPQICEALQFAHDEGVVHRDIKPENILIDQRGRVRIADFGLAKLAATSPQDFTLTGANQVMGTPRYMAPEQMEGSHEVDHRADIYSLGVVFYEMLTGQTPVGHFDPPSKKVAVDGRIDEIVLRSVAREPERRYQQASEVKSDVESISQSSTSCGPPPSELGGPDSSAAEVDFVEVESDLHGPSVAMMAVGMLIAVGHSVTVGVALSSRFDRDTAMIGVPGLVMGLAMFVGGLSMRRLGSRGWAQFGVIAGLIPASPGWLVGAAVSIWANHFLHQPQVRRAFVERSRERRHLVVNPKQSGERDLDRGFLGALVLTVVHTVLFSVLFFILLMVVPPYIGMFEEFAMELPLISQWVIQVSDTVVSYWYLFVLLGMAGIALDFLILFSLGKVGHVLQILAGVAVALLPLLLIGFVLAGIWLPMTTMVEDLS